MIMLLYEGYISEKKSGQQIYMIQSQPISKLKYHHIKILASVFVTALCLLMMFIFIFMIGYLIDGVEGFNFPVMIYKNRLENFMTVSENMVEKSICFISMWRFLLRNFVTSLIISYYISSLFSLISIFVKKKSQLLSIGFGIIVVGYFLTNLINNEIIKTILPFLYLNPYKISNLSYKIVYNSMDIGYLQSITVMILWGLIMSIVGGILSEKVKQKA